MAKLKLLFSKHFLSILLFGGMLLLCACDMTTEMDLEQTQQKMNSPEGCFSCQFFRVIFNAGAELAANSYNRLCNISLSFLALGLMMWLLWHVFKLITSMREPNLAQFWIQLFQTLFKGGFIAILIATKERLYEVINTILEPIALIFIDLSRMLLQSNWVSRVSLTSNLQSSFSSGPGFPSQIGQQLEVLIYRITLALNVGRVLGLRLMLGSDFSNFWLGLITVSIFFLLSLFFPFYLIDGILRLAFVFTLLPLFLVAWVFKYTSHYFKKAWAMFFGAFTQIMSACIFVAICVATFEGFVNIRGYGHLLTPTAQNIDQAFMDEANRMSYSFLSFVLVAFYMYSLSKRINKITTHFTGAPSSSIMAGAIERVKAAAKAVLLTGVALAATAVGLGPVASVAADRAKNSAKDAAKPSGGDE